MRGGGANSFVAVPLLADNGLITKAYLNDMQAAIRQRTPISGENINIKVTDGSYVISATAGLGGGVPEGFGEIILTVCSNGTPDTITVLGK